MEFDGLYESVLLELDDGYRLGPGYFGFNDPLTGTWRPKKFRGKGNYCWMMERLGVLLVEKYKLGMMVSLLQMGLDGYFTADNTFDLTSLVVVERPNNLFGQ